MIGTDWNHTIIHDWNIPHWFIIRETEYCQSWISGSPLDCENLQGYNF